MATIFAGPRSFTGEDVIELLMPGNPELLDEAAESLVDSLRRGGHAARRAGPGEFTARAYLNGRIDLAQAEGVAAMIAARSDAELRAARELLAGRLGERAASWSSRVAALLARVEAGIDFVDQEDVVSISCEAVVAEASVLTSELRGWLTAGAGTERRSHLPRVVLTGAPNAGKSTLFNALLGRERTIRSPLAGTTRDAIAEHLAVETPVGTVDVLLVDSPGVESAAAPEPDDGCEHGGEEYRRSSPATRATAGDMVASSMQRTAMNAVAGADLILRCTPEAPSRLTCEDGPGQPSDRCTEIPVLTKSDLLSTADCPAGMVPTSAVTGAGLDELRQRIAERLLDVGSLRGAESVPVSLRAQGALACAAELLEQATALAGAGDGPLTQPELVAAGLRRALDALGDVCGHVSSDDVLVLVFSRFCIGK